MIILYSIGIRLYYLAILIASPFNQKASLWIKGRKHWKKSLQLHSNNFKNCIWFHCASLGEFEMARPLIEKIKNKNSSKKILITFFSPSGFEIRKNYELADFVCYLPLDTKANARAFIKLIQPSKAVFVKYEIWLHFLNEIKKQNINAILISAVFRKDQRFFKWYGNIFRNGLKNLNQIFVQDKTSYEILNSIEIKSIVAGDTRYDRVFENAKSKKDFPIIYQWKNNEPVIILGSSWPEEEKIALPFLNEKNVKVIIAPHDISESHLRSIESQITAPYIRYSQLNKENYSDKKIILIDNVGMLSSLYQYADIAVIGGGFSGKLHNILEAATFGIPILFGPKHSRFQEASNMLKRNAAFEFKSGIDFKVIIENLLSDDHARNMAGKNALEIVHENLGATEKIWITSFISS